MSSLRQALAPIVLGMLAASLSGCPPQLTGEKCDGDCTCPSSQTCVMQTTNGDDFAFECQDGVNTCDAGVSRDAGSDGGGQDGGEIQFAGTVTLNGGAIPPNATQVYGYASGTPLTDAGNYLAADLTQLAGSSGDFSFSGSVPPATGNGYRFVAVYDSNGRGNDFDTAHAGVFAQESAALLAPGTDAGLGMHLDVQTSTCFTITSTLQQVDVTLLFAAGIVAYDTHNGGPLTQPTDFNSAFAVFDAGSTVPFVDAGSPYGQLTLTPVGTVPETEITNSWLYAPLGVTAISNQGYFIFSFNDATAGKPEYPAGSCAVAYGPPPGYPSNLTVNGMDGGAAWGGLASSTRGEDTVAWQDSVNALPAGVILLGDLITIDDGSGNQLYPSSGAEPQLVTSLSIKDSTVPIGSCDALGKKTCSLNVTSLYEDARKPRSIPYEGGTTVLMFQRAAGAAPGG